MKRRSRGVAIILALSVVVIATLAASALLLTQRTWIRQVELATAHAQAQRLLVAGLDWTRAVLRDDRRDTLVDHPGEPWAMRLPPIPIEQGSLGGHIEDEQSKFNLNNLVYQGRVDPVELAHLQRLLGALELSPTLADALADWLDQDDLIQPPSGAEDAFYRSQSPSTLAGNRPLTDIAELALVRGFDATVQSQLHGFVTALPTTTAVNVNTASAPVLYAITDGLSLDAARQLVAQREHQYFRTSSDFFRQLPKGLMLPYEKIAVGSDYFRVTLTIQVADTQARGTALLWRDRAGGSRIVWRKPS